MGRRQHDDVCLPACKLEMRPVKVLHIASVDKENYYLNNLADFSDASEVELSFVTLAPECDFVAGVRKRGKRAYALDCLSRKRYPAAARRLWKILKNEDPDIVHTHLFDPSIIGLTLAKLQKRRTVLTRHHSDAVHQIPLAAKRKFYLGWDNYISRKADHIIAPSQMVRDILVETEHVSGGKVSIIPYGQTTERFDAITPEKIAKVQAKLGMKKNLALVCVSRLFHRKGHQFLFEALSALTLNGLDATVYLVGDGDHRQALADQAQKLGISERVRFLGWRDDALAIMAAADIIVHPSLEDALSSAVIESVMLERPIVATDISGVRDSLDNGKYGKIVEPADADAFRIGLQEVIDNIDEARQKAKEGRKYLLGYMDAKRVADEYAQVYRRVLV